MNTRPELVLPAGSMEHLKAAISNGADAVYLGAKRFSARATAQNFSEEEMRDGIALCHSHGKMAYLSLNTLIKDSELSEAIELAKSSYLSGIDAVIIQDLGLIRALRELLPDLPLHASTQMTCHNRQGAEFLASLGMKRIVLSRELSLSEIKEIKAALKPLGVGVECFVHGALCFSYSGQCLFSSFAFNKSGNRGRCLQPCRLKYELRSADKKERKSGFVLSMKDLMSLSSIPELIEAGIDAFKVEGRLKSQDYVSSVAIAYRKAIDAHFGGVGPSEEDLKRMKIAFLRDSTTGYAFWNSEMVSAESPSPRGVEAAVSLGVAKGLVKLRLFEDLHTGDKLSIVNGDTAYETRVEKIDGGTSGRAGQVALVALQNKPFLEKGEKLFFAYSKALSIPPQAHALEAREDKAASKRSHNFDQKAFDSKKKKLLENIIDQPEAEKNLRGVHSSDGAKPGIIVFLDESHLGKETLDRLANVKKIACYASSQKQADYFKKMLPGKELYVKTPNIQTSTELDAFEVVVKKEKIICSNLGALQLCIKNKSAFWVDRELNIFNSLAVKQMADLGAEVIIPSIECSLRQIRAMPFKEKLAPLAFFYPLLMTSRAYSKSVVLKSKEYVLIDRMGFKYKVFLDERRLLRVYNPVPLDMLPELGKLGGFGHVSIDLKAVNPQEAATALDFASAKARGVEQKRAFEKFTRGHYERDVE